MFDLKKKNENKNWIYQLIIVELIIIFTSCCKIDHLGTVKDIDGNVYQTVVIGNYEWMAENLKTTTYNNGTEIPNITENSDWASLSSGAYCWYNNNANNADTYGALYNWYAINMGNLCPDGWRASTDDEWKYLEGYVDNQYVAGDSVWDNPGGRGHDAGQRLKVAAGWNPGWNGMDEFGFSALPGGEHLIDSGFFVLNRNGFWWCSTEYDTSHAWYRSMIYSFEEVFRYNHDKRFGFSVRCLRDNQAIRTDLTD